MVTKKGNRWVMRGSIRLLDGTLKNYNKIIKDESVKRKEQAKLYELNFRNTYNHNYEEAQNAFITLGEFIEAVSYTHLFVCQRCQHSSDLRLNVEQLRLLRLACKAELKHAQVLLTAGEWTYPIVDVYLQLFQNYSGINLQSAAFLRIVELSLIHI